MRAYLTAAALLGLIACQAGEPIDDPTSATQAITGNDFGTSDFEGVCGIRSTLEPIDPDNPPPVPDYKYCTCTLVGPNVVLTAARCVWDTRGQKNKPIDDASIDVRFGLDLGFGSGEKQFDVIRKEIHRYFNASTFTDNLALLVLDSEPAVPMVTLNTRPLTASDIPASAPDCYPGSVGDPTVTGCVTLIGYGGTDDEHRDYGSRKKTLAPLSSVSDRFILAGDSEHTTCAGDTGGPGFMDFGDGLVQVSINSYHPGTASCLPTAERIRVDKYVAEYIHAFVDQYDAVCGADGTCCEDEATPCTDCRTPDPDCDPCAWTGNAEDCEEACPTRDWDCPLGSMPGQLCEDDGDCERASSCEVAPDDDSVNFCAASCDPAAESPCPDGMTCDTSSGDGKCIYVPPSPGLQGYPCSCPGDVTVTSCEISTELCLSGICEEEICVTDCDPGAADACPENYADPNQPYTCAASSVISGRNVCLGQVFSGGGGFCTPSSVGVRERGSWGLGALALFGLALAGLFVVRRRRA